MSNEFRPTVQTIEYKHTEDDANPGDLIDGGTVITVTSVKNFRRYHTRKNLSLELCFDKDPNNCVICPRLIGQTCGAPEL